MDIIRPFNQLSLSDRHIAGGKGASLGQLASHAFQVPEGFVILTSAFDQFLAENNLIAQRKKIQQAIIKKEWTLAEQHALQLHKHILSAPIPNSLNKHIHEAYTRLGAKLVAIRSSAVAEDGTDAAWAGILTTYLNTNKDQLLNHIKQCWASLFNSQAIHYLQNQTVAPNLQMAVVVQKMIQSELSGVAFSIHPVTQNHQQIIIEAARGLGEDMVSGAVTPDNYKIDKQTFKILQKTISIDIEKATSLYNQSQENNTTLNKNKAKLNDPQIIDLAKKITAIESLYEAPVDVEWAWANQQYYILQSRPVSRLGEPILEPETSSTSLTKNPLNQHHGFEFGWSDHLAYWAHDRGFDVHSLYKAIEWNRCDNYFVYIKNGTAFAYFSKEDIEKTIQQGDVYLTSDALINLGQVQKTCIKNHKNIYKELNQCTYSELSNQEILKLFKQAIDTYSITLSQYKASGALPTKRLHDSLSQYFSEEELHIFSLPTHLDIMSLEQLDWIELLKHPYSKTRLLQHATKHAWFFMSHFTHEEIIETLTQLFHEDHQKSADTILSEKQKLKKQQETILKTRKEHTDQIRVWQALSTYRIALKGCWASVDFHLIPMFNEICRRSRETIHDLTRYYRVSDIMRLIEFGEQLSQTDKVQRESGTLGVWLEGKMTYYFGQEATQRYQAQTSSLTPKDNIQGIVANRENSTLLRGKARILECNNATQARELGESFRQGDILVTPMAQLNIWHIIKRASAIITDEGGMLSHAAIVARENKIPCIVGTHTATLLIKDGDMIVLDLTHGTVHIDGSS